VSESREVLRTHIIAKKASTFYFVGVTTSKSSIRDMFDVLHSSAEITGEVSCIWCQSLALVRSLEQSRDMATDCQAR
jgi:hypothetical protein